MSVLKQKPRMPAGCVKIEKGGKVLFLKPQEPDWIVVSPNGGIVLQLCNGKRSVEEIAKSLSIFRGEGTKEEIAGFLEQIISSTTFFAEPSAPPTYSGTPLRIVQVSLTSECNLKCVYCYATDRQRSEFSLRRDEHFKLVEDVRSFAGRVSIVLTGGEPLACSHTVELAEYSRGLGHEVHLLTNGTLVNNDNAERIARAFDLIKISIDGSCPEIHDFHRGKGSFDRAMKGADILSRLGANLFIAMTVTRKNIHDIGAMTSKFGPILGFAPLFIAGRAKNKQELTISGEEYYQALAAVDGVKPLSYLCSSLAASKCKPIMKCAIGDGEISIAENGDVFPCQLLHFPKFKAGNIRDQPLKSIYETSRVLKSASELTVLKVSGCKTCSIRFICGGACRARAFYEEGRLDVSGSFCEYEKLAFINGLLELHEF